MSKDGFVAFRLPIAALEPNRYMTDRLDLRLSHRQQCALRRLFDGLDESGARLASGKRITSPADVIRFLLEGVEDQAEPSAETRGNGQSRPARRSGARPIRTAGASDRSDS